MKSKLLPLIFACLLAAGILIGSRMNVSFVPGKSFFVSRSNEFNKLTDVINYIKQEYVDTINERNIVDQSIEKILQNLDPHSAYIPAEMLDAATEPLEGNFEGIGIEFHIQQDTIMVVSTISGGPSEMVGLMPGDRIVKVEGENVAGTGITNTDVLQKLRGKGGTRVTISVLRRLKPGLLEFTITRGRIPINSLEASFMTDSITGYVKLSRFSATTSDEFHTALKKLKGEGMKQLVLDLRGNPGGYLDAAIKVSDEFLPDKKLVVYTRGKSRPKSEYFATDGGAFETGKVVVMIDEGSASASEIVAGALQDWDRATIAGRRSFGKGLVQEQSVFADGSALRLTIARYYTPTGRSIQKAYNNGFEQYQNELLDRFSHGEFEHPDSIHFADSLKFETPGGKIVYGGGGIMPDVFVPLDTTFNSDYLDQILRASAISQFAYDFVDIHRKSLAYDDFDSFNKKFAITENILTEFIMYGEKLGVKKSAEGLKKSAALIRIQLKAFIARQLFRNDGFYRVLLEADNSFKKSLVLLAGMQEKPMPAETEVQRKQGDEKGR